MASQDQKLAWCFQLFDKGVHNAKQVARQLPKVSEPTARKYLRIWLFNTIANEAHKNLLVNKRDIVDSALSAIFIGRLRQTAQLGA